MIQNIENKKEIEVKFFYPFWIKNSKESVQPDFFINDLQCYRNVNIVLDILIHRSISAR